jgi:drug/metabolite transporter (DMT)-like permease
MAMLAIAAFIWGTGFAAQSVGMDYIKPFTFNAVRFFIGGLSLFPVMLMAPFGSVEKTGTDDARGLRTLVIGGLCCGTAVFFGVSLQQIGIVYTTAGKAGFITSLYIIVVPIMGIFFGKRVPMYMLGCVAAAVAGMYLLCIKESAPLNIGDALVLLSAFSLAGHIMVVDHFSPLTDGVKLSCVQFFTCGVLSLVPAVIFENPELSSIWSARMPILYTGVLSCGVAYTLQVLAQKDVNPVIASLIMSLESIFAVLAGWIALGEILTPREISGCVMMFAAIIAAPVIGLITDLRAKTARRERT